MPILKLPRVTKHGASHYVTITEGETRLFTMCYQNVKAKYTENFKYRLVNVKKIIEPLYWRLKPFLKHIKSAES